MTIASTVRSLLGLNPRSLPDPEREKGRILYLHGKGDYLLDVSRTSRHQAELDQIARRNTEAWHRLECTAALLLDATNPADRNAVAVEIDGRRVGDMPGHLATQYREWLQSWQLSRFQARCSAIVVRGAGGEGSAVRYHVRLDLERPFKMTLT